MTGGVRRDAPAPTLVVAGGADRKGFLDRMATNDLKTLAPGRGAPTFFLERTGRVVDRVLVLERGDDAWLIGSPGRAAALLEWLSKHVIADDVSLTDVGAETALVTVCGPAASGLLATRLGVDAVALTPWEYRTTSALGGATVVRAEDVGGESYHLVTSREALPALHAALAELPALSEDEWRALRIEAGVPAFGEDYGERTVPLETRQMDHFSFTKGCYVGQEVIARLHNYKRVKRALVRLRIEGGEVPAPGATLAEGDREIGAVTSAAARGGVTWALAYVDAGRGTPGVRLTLRDGDARRVVEVLSLTPP